jgi:superfamily II DNA or RNA helicase
MVLDEGHHYVADEWKGVWKIAKKNSALTLGLTATPERDDGRGLDEYFEALEVAAQYSELVAGGWIVPAEVWAPKTFIGRNWAENPIDAWFRFGSGQQTIAFFPTIALAEHYAAEFTSRQVTALAFHSEQDKGTRELSFEAFEAGRCMVLLTVAAAIEGLNIPTASCALLARSFHFIGGYLQAPGRVLRASPGKEVGTIIDITGCSVRHGAPDQDRSYDEWKGRERGDGQERPDQESLTIKDPEVIGAEMVLAHCPPGRARSVPPRVVIPEPDPVRLRRELAILKELRRIHTRFGADAARSARKQLEALL